MYALTSGNRSIRFRPCVLLLTCALLLITAPWVLAQQDARFQPDEFSRQQTISLYEQIPGLTRDQVAYGHTAIRAMHYNAQRIFRKICAMEGVTFQQAREAAELLTQERFTFEQVLAFEALSDLGPLPIDLGLTGLAAVQTLRFETSRSFRAYLGVQGVAPAQAITVIAQLNGLSDAHNRAAQALYAIPDLRVADALQGMSTLIRLTNRQVRAAETYGRVKGMDSETMLDGLVLIQRLRQDDAWNARSLFMNPSLSGQEAWDWLISYFALPMDMQEAQYARLDDRNKSVLLQGLYDGGEEIIWKINNLHDVTDQYGYEISAGVLNRYTKEQLRALFNRLDPLVINRFGARFEQADRAQAVTILREATSAARVQTARNLTTANIYAIMAQGSELYDSSFRNVLVPVLRTRIADRHQGDLLNFVRFTDPENRLVSDFIVSCAQKGRLTAFFPTDSNRQKEILSLVADSAFRDEDSILLFSASLTHLLQVLEPQARSYLIGLMGEKTGTENPVFARLINVILQYYLQSHPDLLQPADRSLISRLAIHHGAINLAAYRVTPFAEWKSNGRLGSVSMFHPDDDGRQSFISNANLLRQSGYRLEPSQQYTPGDWSAERERQIRQTIRTASLPALFEAMRTQHFAVTFIKTINGITLHHTQFVYTDSANQMEMLRRFIRSGDEMLAQRGHSYWRSEQIIDPLTQLLRENRITEEELRGKQRFLSLGSCGGVKAYTKLTRLFEGSVDLLATIGTGVARINDPYNKALFEIVVNNPPTISWQNVAQQTAFIFQGGHGQDYLQPGSLTAILHKLLEESRWEADADAAVSGVARPRD
ncbi:hypothetical protein [Desulfobulbus alkaliphilus]|uniref:hypothetical protein n=1 Tax=Desulfobulbus alkaliphilus TaxID=869814 RepID=UPI0019645F05|nr:hypothetical protein [Desulfobulbus alkaliphilus]MBM9536809.1 hypothetical protein [Desulfobulbus alkaliphilus]